jgi:hypothetical protein
MRPDALYFYIIRNGSPTFAKASVGKELEEKKVSSYHEAKSFTTN